MGAEIQAMCNCNSDGRQNLEGKTERHLFERFGIDQYVNVITGLKEVE